MITYLEIQLFYIVHMTSNYDVQISTDDTIELDAVIEEWNDKNSLVNPKNKTQIGTI